MPSSSRSLSPPRFTLASAARESTGLLELPRLALALPDLVAKLPRGQGEPILVLPGFGADDTSTWPLRRFLRGLGYDARGWGLGVNVRSVPESIERMTEKVRRRVERSGDVLPLIGWSLGGYIAREVARDLPEHVRQVITLGSPVIGGPKYTTVAGRMSGQGLDLDEVERQVEERKRTPLRVPVTAIYSRRDGVVDWRACIDPENGGPIEHVESRATHLGLGFNTDVYRVVAWRLAEVRRRERA